jgi:N-acyl-D-amino-acid deacylase
VLADQYPYTAGSTTLLALLPGWALAGGLAALRSRLADPAARGRIAADLTRRERGELRAGEEELDPASVVIADVPPGPLARYRGRSLADSARAEGIGASQVVLRLVEGAPGGVPIVWHGMDEADVRTVLAHRWWRSPATAGRLTLAWAACRTRAATARSCGCSAATCASSGCCRWRRPCGR